MPRSEGIQPVSAEVLEWAKSVGKTKPSTSLVDIPTEIEGFHVRSPRGSEISSLGNDDVHRLDGLTRELTALERDQTERRPLARAELIAFAEEHPQARGGSSDPDHGNYNVTAVPQRHPVFDDPVIIDSLGERANEVYPATEVRLQFRGSLKTVDGQELTADRVYEILRHALLGSGASERDLDKLLTKRAIEKMADRRNNLELARLIREGVPVEGISFATDWRVEIDDIDKNRPIKVRRPRRKRLIAKRNKPRG